MRIFGSIESYIECNSLLPFRIILWTSFEPPSSNPGGDRHIICARQFFGTKFTSEQLLFETFFDAIRIFGSVESYIECNSLFPFRIVLRTYSEPPSSNLRGDRHVICPRRFFGTKFTSEQLLFETFLDVMRNFCSVQPKSEISPLLQSWYQQFYLRPWSLWTANSDKKLNVNKPCVTSQKTVFWKFCKIFCQFSRCHKFW